jgi:4-alpha-glucanotransferase
MDFADAMVRAAMLSGSGLALVQLQDVMGLDGLARMNTPGTVNNENWSWRFAEGELTDAMLLRLKQHTEEGGRHATTQGRSP